MKSIRLFFAKKRSTTTSEQDIVKLMHTIQHAALVGKNIEIELDEGERGFNAELQTPYGFHPQIKLTLKPSRKIVIKITKA